VLKYRYLLLLLIIPALVIPTAFAISVDESFLSLITLDKRIITIENELSLIQGDLSCSPYARINQIDNRLEGLEKSLDEEIWVELSQRLDWKYKLGNGDLDRFELEYQLRNGIISVPEVIDMGIKWNQSHVESFQNLYDNARNQGYRDKYQIKIDEYQSIVDILIEFKSEIPKHLYPN